MKRLLFLILVSAFSQKKFSTLYAGNWFWQEKISVGYFSIRCVHYFFIMPPVCLVICKLTLKIMPSVCCVFRKPQNIDLYVGHSCIHVRWSLVLHFVILYTNICLYGQELEVWLYFRLKLLQFIHFSKTV